MQHRAYPLLVLLCLLFAGNRAAAQSAFALAEKKKIVQAGFEGWANGTGNFFDLLSDDVQWTITGTSPLRGLGLEITRAVLATGDKVVATVRRNPGALAGELNHQNLHVAVLDVTDEAQTRAAVAEALARFGRIDVLVNNAGYGILGAVEEASDGDVRRNYETNVFGLLNVTRAVLPHLRRQRSGHVINITSVGGLSASAGWGLYGSTKFAVEGITEALAKELAPWASSPRPWNRATSAPTSSTPGRWTAPAP